MTDSDTPVLEVEELTKYFSAGSGGSLLDTLLRRSDDSYVKAVDGVSFELMENETIGVVGESGCGKSTMGKSILRLIEPTSGDVRFKGESVTDLSGRQMRKKRTEMQFIFQDPTSALNPKMKIKHLLNEPLENFYDFDKAELAQRTDDLLEQIDLPKTVKDRYPHELSGGQKQRVVIGRAIASNPDLIVADEPVTGLDVSVQSNIITMLEEIQEEFELSLLFIAHDLSVVRYISDRVMVLYLGHITELGDSEAVFTNPQHPYTRELKRAIPRSHPDDDPAETEITEGEPPSPLDPPSGCPFHTRCPAYIGDICEEEYPDPVELQDGRLVSCHHFEEGDPPIEGEYEQYAKTTIADGRPSPTADSEGDGTDQVVSANANGGDVDGQ
ncbi:ABC transporter ATP-binding protein [Natrarchaeobius chitinivorans]|uniref:ABC transporter ATP-binding protein n=1 Tax=Natrarchaeobius chitinivorans TaxID=1679083 RepID=A0A3N6PD71_NATCH|nr:ABC transporter ATP-binding protein [Natrarchaeobius chitinivorans]RQG94875.1 ABC transporter ATP-binding protein [Natrarchaeobius chitinivorans]